MFWIGLGFWLSKKVMRILGKCLRMYRSLLIMDWEIRGIRLGFYELERSGRWREERRWVRIYGY